ncbi:MAG: cytochrome c oxidase subunit II [Chloroflexota bacterium]
MNFSSAAERGKTIVAVVIVTVLLFIGGAVISMMTPWLMGEQASAQAQQIDGLMRLMMFIGGMVFLLVQGLIIWAVIFYRRREGDDGDGPNIHGNYTLEFVWTLIPTIIVFILTIASYAVFVQTRAPQDNELVVHADAQRYAFAFQYQDDVTGEFVNDTVLRTYVGRPVRLEMNASDVIHAFWIPAMRVKQDMLPGRDTYLRFTPTEPGVYPVVCTELCGGGHGGMRAEIYVYPDEDSYAEWFDTVLDCKLNPPEDPVARGQARLASGEGGYGCAGCHVLDSLGWIGQVGPSLNNIADTAVSRAAAAGNESAEAYIYESIRNSQAYIVPGYASGIMPNWDEEQMSNEYVADATAYLLTQGQNIDAPEGPACPVPAFEDVLASYEAENQEVASR